MARIIAIIAAVMLTGLSYSDQLKDPSLGITWKAEMVSERAEGPEYRVTLMNNTLEAIYLRELVSSCSCTHVGIEPQVLANGHFITFVAFVDSTSKIGSFAESITIKYDGGEKVIWLRGSAKPLVALSTMLLTWQSGDKSPQKLVITSLRGLPIVGCEVISESRGFKISHDAEGFPLGRVVVTIVPVANADAGEHQITVRVRIRGVSAPRELGATLRIAHRS